MFPVAQLHLHSFQGSSKDLAGPLVETVVLSVVEHETPEANFN